MEPPYTPPPPGPMPPPPPPSSQKPGKVQAIAIMTLIGGILGILAGIGWFIYGVVIGAMTLGIGCLVLFPALYSLVMGVMVMIKGTKLIGQNDRLETAPKTTAILQIINIVACDVVNVVMGILILVFLKEPEVQGYYRA